LFSQNCPVTFARPLNFPTVFRPASSFKSALQYWLLPAANIRQFLSPKPCAARGYNMVLFSTRPEAFPQQHVRRVIFHFPVINKFNLSLCHWCAPQTIERERQLHSNLKYVENGIALSGIISHGYKPDAFYQQNFWQITKLIYQSRESILQHFRELVQVFHRSKTNS